MLQITAKKDGFRRAGMEHYGTQSYADGFFSPVQVAMLKAEPLLEVMEMDAVEGKESKAKGK